MGTSESCFRSVNKEEEANINFSNENNQQVHNESKEQTQEKNTYEMLLENHEYNDCISSKDISMVLYEDKIYINKPINKPKVIITDSECIDNNVSNDNDYIIDLDYDVWDDLDHIIIKPINTQYNEDRPQESIAEKVTSNNNISNLTTHLMTDKHISNETVSERSDTQYTHNYTDYGKSKERPMPISRDTRSKMTSIHQRTHTLNYGYSFDFLDDKTIASYKINTKAICSPLSVKSMTIDSLFSIEKMNNCSNEDIIFQSELEKVSAKTLKSTKSYCISTKTSFSIYKSKEAFLFKLKPQYTFKLNSSAKVGYVSLTKPLNKSQGQGNCYLLFRYDTTSIVLFSSNEQLLSKWMILIQYLLNTTQTIRPSQTIN